MLIEENAWLPSYSFDNGELRIGENFEYPLKLEAKKKIIVIERYGTAYAKTFATFPADKYGLILAFKFAYIKAMFVDDPDNDTVEVWGDKVRHKGSISQHIRDHNVMVGNYVPEIHTKEWRKTIFN